MRGRIVRVRLGGGERCEAYLTFNRRLRTPTVTKLLRPGLRDDARARRAIAREGTLLCTMRHPGLVHGLAMDVEGARPFVEMEHVGGARLSTLIRERGPLGSADVARIGRQVAAALEYLHGAGAVHLDVKPSNIVLASRPRLLDLSVSRRRDRAHLIDGFVGTDAYMAPEQADPALWSTIGPKADAWGVGATLYHAVTGRLPHTVGRGDARGAERFPQLVETVVPPDFIPRSSRLLALIMGALSRSADDRPSMRDLSEGCAGGV